MGSTCDAPSARHLTSVGSIRRVASAVVVAALLAACSTTTAPATPTADGSAGPTSTAAVAERTTVRIASLTGPTTMGLVGLMRDAEEGVTAQDYQVVVHGTADEVVPLLVQGEVDVALIPANLAAVLYNRTLDAGGAPALQVAAISTLGMLEVLEAGDTVHDVADLAGRTVYSTGKGTTPEYVLDYVLEGNGLDPAADLTVEYRSEATEVAALLASEPGAVGVLPQPYATVVTAQHPGVRTAISLAEEWREVSPGTEAVTGVAVVRSAFAAEHPDAVADFLTEYEQSIAFTTTKPEAAAPLIAEEGLVPSADLAEAAIPACNFTYLDGNDLESVLGAYLAVLFAADPASVGGSLPGDDFYYAG